MGKSDAELLTFNEEFQGDGNEKESYKIIYVDDISTSLI